MADYQKMYYILCEASSRALDALESGDMETAHELLQAALNEAEDVYIGEDGAAHD